MKCYQLKRLGKIFLSKLGNVSIVTKYLNNLDLDKNPLLVKEKFQREI